MVVQPQPAIAMEPATPDIIGSEALLISLAQHDPVAFAPLYEAYFDAIYRYCYLRLGTSDAAEDAASLVFINALAALPHFRPTERTGSFRAWLFAIAHNVVANQYRRHSRQRLTILADAQDVPDAAPSPEDVVVAAEARQSVHDVLSGLTDEQRRVVELRLAGLTDAEIARVLGRRHGAVRATQYRAVLRLRALLGRENQESAHA